MGAARAAPGPGRAAEKIGNPRNPPPGERARRDPPPHLALGRAAGREGAGAGASGRGRGRAAPDCRLRDLFPLPPRPTGGALRGDVPVGCQERGEGGGRVSGRRPDGGHGGALPRASPAHLRAMAGEWVCRGWSGASTE
jgi:hypothetical protein